MQVEGSVVQVMHAWTHMQAAVGSVFTQGITLIESCELQSVKIILVQL